MVKLTTIEILFVELFFCYKISVNAFFYPKNKLVSIRYQLDISILIRIKSYFFILFITNKIVVKTVERSIIRFRILSQFFTKIRSYIGTARKQGSNVFDAIYSLFTCQSVPLRNR